MLNRSVLGVLAASILAPGIVQAQGVAIDHKAVGCIVAGQFPRLNACFDPTSNVARARVFFRGAGPHWYFVDMRSDAPCFSGILPKPKASLKKIDYYVEVVDKKFAESRTAEFYPEVVPDGGACRKDLLGAPYLEKASVTVGAAAGAPAIPAGFSSAGIVGAGGVSTGVIVGAVVGAGAAVAGGIALANNGDSTNTTTLPILVPTPPTTAAPVTTTTTTTTTTTPAPPAFAPSLDVSPTVGPPPLKVLFDMCSSTGDNLKYFYDFNADGINDFQGPCAKSATYTTSGFSSVDLVPAAPPTLPGCVAQCYRTCVYENKGTRRERVQCFEGCVQVCPNSFAVNSNSEPNPARRLAWTSDLGVPGASGQVVVNGERAVFATPGRSVAAVPGRRGENRVEAQLVQGAGRPGTWRFELGTTSSLEVGSLRVVAGEVSLVTGDAIVFRLSGTPGERVVFSFRTSR